MMALPDAGKVSRHIQSFQHNTSIEQVGKIVYQGCVSASDMR